MSLEEKVYSKNIEIQEKIKVEIDNVANGLSKRDGKQLHLILSELEKILNQKGVLLNFPRMIVDSWDYQDELGIELMEFSELYNRWK